MDNLNGPTGTFNRTTDLPSTFDKDEMKDGNIFTQIKGYADDNDAQGSVGLCCRWKRNDFLVVPTLRRRVNIGLGTRFVRTLYLWLSLATTGRSPPVHLGHALYEPRHNIIISWSPSYYYISFIFFFFGILVLTEKKNNTIF